MDVQWFGVYYTTVPDWLDIGLIYIVEFGTEE